MPFLPSLRANASLIDVFKAFADPSRPLIEFHEVLLRGPSPFSTAERELIAAYVSGLNGCRYCHGVHTATAERLGVAAGTVDALLHGGEAAAKGAPMQPVLDLARKLTLEPAGVTTADAEAVLAAGWDETALYHAVAVTALFNLMNRLVEGLGIELDPSYVEPARGARLPAADRNDEQEVSRRQSSTRYTICSGICSGGGIAANEGRDGPRSPSSPRDPCRRRFAA